MFVQGQSTSPEGSKPDRSHGARKGTNHLLRLQVLGMLMIVAVACQSPTPAAVTQQWVPPYAQWYLTAGQVQVQWSDDSDWIVLKSETLITVEETGQIIADDAMGARFSVGSGSVLEFGAGFLISLGLVVFMIVLMSLLGYYNVEGFESGKIIADKFVHFPACCQ